MKKEDWSNINSKVCGSCQDAKCKTYFGCCKNCMDYMIKYPAYPTCEGKKCPAREEQKVKEFLKALSIGDK